MSRRVPREQRLAVLVIVGVALAVLGSLARWQWLSLGVGFVAIGVAMLVVQRRQRAR